MAVSTLRPEIKKAEAGDFCPDKGTAYLMVLNAVESKRGLVHGHLHSHGESCAIGSYFDVNPKLAIPGGMTDEIAAVNDSMPNASEVERKAMVARWLRWKLTQIGMPGFNTKADPRKKQK